MKKRISIIVLASLTLAAQAFDFRSISFMPSGIKSITITNAAAAPLGGYTNVNSYGYTAVDPFYTPGSNSLKLTWTNSIGNWVIPTNAAIGTVSGVQFLRTPESTPLTADVVVPQSLNGLPSWGSYASVSTNSLLGFGNATAAAAEGAMVGNCKIFCKIVGDTSAANTLNLIFVGVPDGTNEISGTAGPVFQWGITAAAGTTAVETNLPVWRFVGCKSIRLRSAALTTTTASAIGVTIQNLSLNGFYP